MSTNVESLRCSPETSTVSGTFEEHRQRGVGGGDSEGNCEAISGSWEKSCFPAVRSLPRYGSRASEASGWVTAPLPAPAELRTHPSPNPVGITAQHATPRGPTPRDHRSLTTSSFLSSTSCRFRRISDFRMSISLPRLKLKFPSPDPRTRPYPAGRRDPLNSGSNT